MESKQGQNSSLVSLLVVIGVVGVLVVLFLPAAQHSKNTDGRRTWCANNMRNLMVGLINFEQTAQTFPPYRGTYKLPDDSYLEVPWPIYILQQIDRPDLVPLYRGENGLSGYVSGDPATDLYLYTNPTQGMTPYWELFICPSDASQARSGSPTSYVVNTGRSDSALGSVPDYPENGVFQRENLTDADIGPSGKRIGTLFIQRHDGLNTTILMTENLDAGNWPGFNTPGVDPRKYGDDAALDPSSGGGSIESVLGCVWWPQVDLASAPYLKINGEVGKTNIAKSMGFARPSSFHRGTVNIAFCGGNIRSVGEDMDYKVYIQLMTPLGRNATEPNGELTKLKYPFVADLVHDDDIPY